jgi:hypothetical protein
MDADGYDPGAVDADQVNERCDAAVFALANAFRPEFEPELNQYTMLIRRLKIPCVIVGVGAQAGLDLAQLKDTAMDAPVRAFVSAVLDRCSTIGVRGEFTQAYLRRLGFTQVEVIGCPSIFACGPGSPIDKPERPPRPGDPVAVNHTPGVGRKVSDFLAGVLAAYPNSVFVSQSEGDAREWRAAGGDARVRRFTDAPSWFAFMRTRMFSVGTRIHGAIAALASGVPAMVAVHDSRTLELARHHRIPHVHFGQINAMTDLAALYEQADFAPFNASLADGLDRYRAFLERNGVPHSLDDPAAGAEFDRLAAAPFAADSARLSA